MAEADPLAPTAKKDGEEDMAWLVGAENVGVPEDRRGKGESQITGRKVRKYSGSTRPPGIDPQVWFKVLKAKDRKQLIDQYEAYLAKLQEAHKKGEPPDLVAPSMAARGADPEQSGLPQRDTHVFASLQHCLR